MAVSDYKTNPDENTTISGINIAEGCAPSGINNAIRQLMADVRQNSDGMTGLLAKYLPLTGGSLTGLLNATRGINIPNIFSATPDGNINLSKTTNFYQLQNGSFRNNDVIVLMKDSQQQTVLPAGGYWACIIIIYDKMGSASAELSGVYPGGTIIPHTNFYASSLCVRVY